MPETHVYKFSAPGISDAARASELKKFCRNYPGVVQVDDNRDKELLRLISQEPLNLNSFLNEAKTAGFELSALSEPPAPQKTPPPSSVMRVSIEGMTCRSCELTIERAWHKLAGVKRAKVNAATGQAELTLADGPIDIGALQSALGSNRYRVGPTEVVRSKQLAKERPSFIRLIGLFGLVFMLGLILSNLGLFQTSFTPGAAMSFGAIFVVGLIAASSSCIAVTGGLLLSSAARFNERYASATRAQKIRPVLIFVLGRIASYAVLGGLLGVVGSALSPSPAVTAVITIVAALYMLIMGLDMLGLAPVWLKRFLPRLPKSLSHRVLDADDKSHPAMPFFLGAGTFFLPCGFTQALQLYALTTGSFAVGATSLLAFALGTAPALIGLGVASASLKGKTGKFFFQFSGALVVVLGLWNIQNGLAIAGYSGPDQTDNLPGPAAAADPGVVIKNGVQVVKMKVNSYGYSPERFTIQAGVPVRWEVDGTQAGGCAGVIISRQLGIQKLLESGINVFEFTPDKPGEIKFSCSMGMYRGSFTVVPQS